MSGEEELAFLKAHLDEPSPALLRELKRDIVAEKKPRLTLSLKGRANDLLVCPVGLYRALPAGETSASQKAPRATVGKRKANKLDKSGSGGSMEPATSRPAPGLLSGAGSAPLPAQAKGSSAQGTVVKPTASMGEQAAFSGRQISYADVFAAYAGVVAERPIK
jgi:hypothetical protein